MKANELRIGNYLEIDQYPNDRVIVQIEKGADIDQCLKLNPKPIPLTEEWLLKFGFEFLSNELGVNFYQIQVGIDFIVFSKEGHWSISSGKSAWYMDRNFKSPKYAHQLQNLYFALTGKELTYEG